jgi:1-aminocyclopropane-1-carboxylate deaminase
VAGFQREAYGAVSGNWSIEYGFHFGGFARRSSSLDQFIADFERRHGISLDWVYVAKMLYGIFALAQQGSFPAGTAIVAIVTG